MTDIWLRQWFYNELDNIFAVMDPANGAPIVLPSQVASPGEIFSSRGYSQTTNGIGGTNGSIEQFFPGNAIPDGDYWAPYFIAAVPRANAIGSGARNEHRGAFQITYFGPISSGETEIQHMMKTIPITEAFKRGRSYSAQDQFCVYCEQSYIAYSGRDKDRWQIVIRVKFRATIVN